MSRILALVLLLAGIANAADVYELRRFPDRATLTAERWEALGKALAADSRKPTAAEEQTIAALVKGGDYKPLAFVTRNRQTILAVIRLDAAQDILNGDDYRLIPSEKCAAIIAAALKP